MHESCKNKCFVCIAGRQGTLRAAAAEMECIVMIKHPPLRLHLIVPLWKLSSNTSCAERVIQTEDPTTENTDAVSKCVAFLCIHTTVFPSWLLSLSYELPLLGPLNEDVRLYSLFIWLLNAAPHHPSLLHLQHASHCPRLINHSIFKENNIIQIILFQQ